MCKRGLGEEWGRLCQVQVNSEQMSLEYFAEAGERLRSPDVGRTDVETKQSRVVTVMSDLRLPSAMAEPGVQLM